MFFYEQQFDTVTADSFRVDMSCVLLFLDHLWAYEILRLSHSHCIHIQSYWLELNVQRTRSRRVFGDMTFTTRTQVALTQYGHLIFSISDQHYSPVQSASCLFESFSLLLHFINTIPRLPLHMRAAIPLFLVSLAPLRMAGGEIFNCQYRYDICLQRWQNWNQYQLMRFKLNEKRRFYFGSKVGSGRKTKVIERFEIRDMWLHLSFIIKRLILTLCIVPESKILQNFAFCQVPSRTSLVVARFK